MAQEAKKIPSSRFETTEVRASKKYDSFRQSMGVVFDVSRPDKKGGDFLGRITSHHLGNLMLVRCQASGQTFMRTPKMIAADGMDHYLVQLFVSGSTTESRGATGKRDQLIVIDTSQPWQARNDDFDNITLVLPRRLLAQKLASEHGHHGRTIPKHQALGGVLADMMRSIQQNADDLTFDETGALVQPLVDLTATILNQSVSPTVLAQCGNVESAADGTIFLRAKQFIEARCCDPELTPEVIQKALGISRAHLYRAFAGVGGIANYVRGRRLNHALRQLTAPGPHRQSIKEIAFQVGFTTETVFSRAFKQHYGLSPKEARYAAQGYRAGADDPNGLLDERLWEEWIRQL